MVFEGIATGTGIGALFSSTGVIIVAVVGLIGLVLKIPEIAILAFILFLIMINAIIGLPPWFILVVVVILGAWLLNRLNKR
jgi:hypothetical protein